MELQGTTVKGQYEVAKRLQSGFYGVTWLAKDTVHSREVCLKASACINSLYMYRLGSFPHRL